MVHSVSETINQEAKEEKFAFIRMLLGALGASLLGNLLTSKKVKRPNSSNIPGWGIIQVG